MYAPERHQRILASAQAEGRVEVTSLARVLGVAPETLRRDLSVLERQGLLQRVHGGAIPVDRLTVEPAVDERDALMSAEKDRIAEAALDELPDGGSVLLDAGTTTVRLARRLPADRELTVVTHSLPVAAAVAGRRNIVLHLVGGTVRGVTLAAVGPWAVRDLADVRVDVAFLGANGVTAQHGVTTPDLAEAAVKRAIATAAWRVVVLADHTKIGRTDLAHVVGLDRVDALITDDGLEPDRVAALEAAGPTVVRA